MPRRRIVEDSSDEEPSQSQPASQLSQSQGGGEISDQDKKVLAGNVCNYFLVSDCKKVYGYKVVELEKKNQFIMINTLMMNNQDDDDLLLAPTSNSEVANIGLVTAILAGIFMSGQVMQEGPMREYLKKLGIDIELPRRAPYLWQRHKIYSSRPCKTAVPPDHPEQRCGTSLQ
ncbi:hypothetical protein C7M84_002374 [Penaeus vannamei]|uniref:MAGE domain-containing protein n=1 Tax=Penaeus vannamei TaxID=6689 RepID=A0A423TR65_PENVA|nr:hypothetical protein C7M84_002374 [Penaeus vannamei]